MKLIRKTSGRFSPRRDYSTLAPLTADVKVARRVALVLTAPGEGRRERVR